MTIIETTTYTFHPTKERDLIENFEACNKKGWVKSENTQEISYTYTKSRVVDIKGRN